MSRWVRLLVDNNTLTTQTQYDSTLTVSNFIGALFAKYTGLGGATPVTANLMGLEIRCQVIADGSKVLFNMTAREAQQRYQYLFGSTMDLATAGAAGATNLTVPIMFGRYWGDPEYVVPGAAFKTLIFRNQFTVAPSANTDLFNAAGCVYRLYSDEYMSNDVVASKWIIKQVEIESHVNGGAAAVNRIRVPLQGRLLRHMHWAYTTATGAAAAIVTSLYTEVNTGEWRPFTGTTVDLQWINTTPGSYTPNGVFVVDYDRAHMAAGADGPIDLKPLGNFDIYYTEAATAGTVTTVCEYLLRPSEV